MRDDTFEALQQGELDEVALTSDGFLLPTYARKMADLFHGDPFPYGIEENRPTLEQFLRYTREQGIAHRHAAPEEIFPKGIMTSVRV